MLQIILSFCFRSLHEYLIVLCIQLEKKCLHGNASFFSCEKFYISLHQKLIVSVCVVMLIKALVGHRMQRIRFLVR